MKSEIVARHLTARVFSKQKDRYHQELRKLDTFNYLEIKRLPNNFFSPFYEELFERDIVWSG